MPSGPTSPSFTRALKAIITIQQALETDTFLTVSEQECDQMFEDVKPVINQPIDGESRWTLLHLAAAHGRVDFCTRLMQLGAHVNVVDSENQTPYFLIPDSETELKELFKKNGAIDNLDYFKLKEEPDFKSAGFLNEGFFRKLLLVFVVPFIVLLFVNGVSFAVKFLLCSLLFYFISAGYFVSELTVRPVWYNYKVGSKTLPLNNLPEEWRGTYHDPKFHFGYDFENVTFESDDDGHYVYSGWFIPGRQGVDVPKRKMALVCTHGGGRDRRNFLRHLPMFHDAGYSCLLYDLREHGLSSGTGKGFTYGIKERFDVQAAARWMKQEKGFERVGCLGTSVGAASSIAAAALSDKWIDLVIAENPMLTASQLSGVLLHRIIGPLFRGTRFSRPIFWAFKKICSIWLNARCGNVPSKKCQPMHVVDKISPRPLLLMHGTFDAVVPAAHGQQLYDLAKEPKEFWLLPEAGHTTLYDHSPEEFKRRVMTFLEKYESGNYKMPEAPTAAALINATHTSVRATTPRHYSASRIPRNLRSQVTLDEEDVEEVKEVFGVKNNNKNDDDEEDDKNVKDKNNDETNNSVNVNNSSPTKGANKKKDSGNNNNNNKKKK